MATDDPFDLARFVAAQAPTYAGVLAELAAGRKRTHWIWYIFPQLRGLGRSDTARRYGLSGRAEAEAYLAHPVLGPRLRACTQLMLDIEGRSLTAIMAFPDDLKFISCMTLFGACAADPAPFHAALAKYAGGQPDTATLDLLAQ
jgi:uncharacterized protein (DUF1810 family)